MLKKGIVLFFLFSVIIILLSCHIPSSVQVKKDFDVSIPWNINLDIPLSAGSLESSIGIPGARIVENTAANILTFVVFIPLYEATDELRIALNLIYMGFDSDEPRIFNFPDPVPISDVIDKSIFDRLKNDLKGFTNELGGFEFKEVKSQFYFYSHNQNFTDFANFDFFINGNKAKAIPRNESILNIIEEDRVSIVELPDYKLQNDPDLTELLNYGAKDDFEIKIDFYLLGEKTKNELDIPNIKVGFEAAFWITLELVAGPGGVNFTNLAESLLAGEDDLLGFLKGENGDLFNRKTAGEKNEIINILDAFTNVELGLGMNINPFGEANILIICDNIGVIPASFSKEAILLSIDNIAMNKIKNNIFAPKIEIFFDEGKGFIMPRNLLINRINIKAGLDYEFAF